MKRTLETYSDNNIGALGVAALVGTIAVFDALSPQTISEFVHKQNENGARPLVALALGVTASHLLRPKSLSPYDPITQIGGMIREHI
jgi:hypothetical protein